MINHSVTIVFIHVCLLKLSKIHMAIIINSFSLVNGDVKENYFKKECNLIYLGLQVIAASLSCQCSNPGSRGRLGCQVCIRNKFSSLL